MRANKLVHAVELVKTRRARLLRKKASGVQRVLQIGAIILGASSVVAAVAALGALPFYFFLSAGTPPIERAEELLEPVDGELLQPTRLYDRTGETLILTLAPEGIERKFILAADAPWLAKAFVASNQPDFLKAGAFSFLGIADPPESIAEKLVGRVLLPNQPEGWLRNVRSNFLAAVILEKYGIEKVLTWSLNSTDFGNWAFGVEAAAQLYFGKSAAQLSLAESALLAAVAQAPALNPQDAPELSIRFQQLVLSAMVEQSLITQQEFDAAIAESLVFAPVRETVSLAPDFTRLALEQLETELGYTRLLNGGLNVITTIDYTLQQEALTIIGANDPGLVILDPVNDRLLALSGEISADDNSRSPLYPFIYLNAFAQGMSPANLIWDVDESSRTSVASDHGPVTLRQSLASNFPNATRILSEDPSIERSLSDLFQAVGIETTLSSNSISPMDLARLYSVLAQNGLSAQSGFATTSNTVLFAANLNGGVELDHTRTEWQSIVSPELSYLVNDVLSDTTFWPAGFATTRPATLLTGSDKGWQIMFSPQRVIVIWNDQVADPILASSLFEAAHRGLPMKDWDVPGGLASLIVCVPSGQLPDEDCSQTRREWFLRGTEPAETDTLHKRIAINSLNGKLATVFTPAEFVQEKVFLMIPPEAESWAQAAGIPLPPKDYDPIPEILVNNRSPAINKPAPFHEVSGVVRIIGSLGADYTGYDVQVGEGLRPAEWTVIANGVTAPRNGVLAEWDVEGLSGIWAIQLQVWRENGSINRAYSIITIE